MKFIDKYIRDEVKADNDLYRQQYLFVSSGLLSILSLFFYSIFYLVIDFTIPYIICFFLMVFGMIVLYLGTLKNKNRISANIFAGFALLGLWIITYTTGGLSSPTLPWLAVSPAFAFLFANRRSGTIFMLLLILSLAVLVLLDTYNIKLLPTYNYINNTVLYVFVYSGFIFFILYVIFYIYERGMKELLIKLKKAKTEIEINVNELRNTNNELQIATQKAEASSIAKAQFLSSMSHEIRTPMNTVIGMIHLLTQENPKPEQVENLTILKFSAENLLALINDILDFSKIEAGKIDIDKIDFNLFDLLNSVVNSHKQKANDKFIELNLKLDKNVPEMVIGDPNRIAQILNNIIGNAVKFTSKGGVDFVVNLQNIVDDHYLIDFSVNDSGIGIADNKLNSIFDNFTQADTGIARNFGGTGLGLAISKKLLELMGSKIYVESKLGKGSKFYFTLNLSKSDIIVHKELISHFSKQIYESLNGVKILVVEDNSSNRIIASKFLRKWDIEVEFAENGQEAIDKISNNDYDLVLMDLQMPVMDGYDATYNIRKLNGEKYAKIPILALTVSALLDVQDRVYTVGMNDYITKPFIPNDLYAKIRKWTNK